MNKFLQINTSGIVERHATIHHNRYEATDYRVLKEIKKLKIVHSNSVLVDYGCGLGE